MLLSGRADNLTDEGLLGVLIGQQSSNRAAAILAEHPIPDGLWRVCAEDLVAMDGVGPAAAARVLACLEMSRRASAWKCARR
ncbi:MAG: DNA repair protein, partial [Actinomycetota bacterium]|nr:DNA repair protein [Actinomycetota bacterium]